MVEGVLKSGGKSADMGYNLDSDGFWEAVDGLKSGDDLLPILRNLYYSGAEFTPERMDEIRELDSMLHNEKVDYVKEFAKDQVFTFVHGILDIGGFIPYYGDVFDLVNGVFYLAEGDAALGSLYIALAAVPIGDTVLKKAKLVLGETVEAAAEAIYKVGKEALSVLAGMTSDAIAGVIEGIGKVSKETAELLTKMVEKGVLKDVAQEVGEKILISEADRIKIDAWGKYRPDDDMYAKYKGVFDNDKYYHQDTGEVIWPLSDGFDSKGSVNFKLEIGNTFDRFGSNDGTFASPIGTSYETRSMRPGSEKSQYSQYIVLKAFDVKAGTIAPWFDMPGGGTQYLLPMTIDELLLHGYIFKIN